MLIFMYRSCYARLNVLTIIIFAPVLLLSFSTMVTSDVASSRLSLKAVVQSAGSPCDWEVGSYIFNFIIHTEGRNILPTLGAIIL